MNTNNNQNIFRPYYFNIFGCEYSTDIDIAIVVPSAQIISDYKNKKINLDLSLINDNLVKLGFDLNKIQLDTNLIYLDPKTNNLSECLIGTKDTQNIIYYTYSLHPQVYNCIFSNSIELDLFDKVRFFSKLILDSMENLLGKPRYKELRNVKASVYSDLSYRFLFSIQILNEINWIELFDLNKNLIKSLTMKLSQIILLYNDEEAYTKKTISLKINQILPTINPDNILYMLSRGALGHIDNKSDNKSDISNIFNILINQYEIIINEFKKIFNLDLVNIDLDSIITNDLMLDEFVISPEKPTKKLSEHIDNLFVQTKSLNEIFIINSFGFEHIPNSLKHLIHLENQRSIEWLELLKFYKCGNTIYNKIDYIDSNTNFNLIRGCLGEKLFITIVDYINWFDILGFDVYKCCCGLIVESKGIKDSKGISPDLLLINKTNSEQVIPVEIKTIVSEPNILNRKFLREIKLAHKQLNTSIDLIEKNTLIKTFGLIIFCFIHEDKIIIKHKKYYK
jgi:hypothetical protein